MCPDWWLRKEAQALRIRVLCDVMTIIICLKNAASLSRRKVSAHTDGTLFAQRELSPRLLLQPAKCLCVFAPRLPQVYSLRLEILKQRLCSRTLCFKRELQFLLFFRVLKGRK